jgi:hypothetical protein
LQTAPRGGLAQLRAQAVIAGRGNAPPFLAGALAGTLALELAASSMMLFARQREQEGKRPSSEAQTEPWH